MSAHAVVASVGHPGAHSVLPRGDDQRGVVMLGQGEAGELDRPRREWCGDLTEIPTAELSPRSVRYRVGGLTVDLASLDDIIAAKEFAGRDNDREGLPEVLEIQRRRRDASSS